MGITDLNIFKDIYLVNIYFIFFKLIHFTTFRFAYLISTNQFIFPILLHFLWLWTYKTKLEIILQSDSICLHNFTLRYKRIFLFIIISDTDFILLHLVYVSHPSTTPIPIYEALHIKRLSIFWGIIGIFKW